MLVFFPELTEVVIAQGSVRIKYEKCRRFVHVLFLPCQDVLLADTEKCS